MWWGKREWWATILIQRTFVYYFWWMLHINSIVQINSFVTYYLVNLVIFVNDFNDNNVWENWIILSYFSATRIFKKKLNPCIKVAGIINCELFIYFFQLKIYFWICLIRFSVMIKLNDYSSIKVLHFNFVSIILIFSPLNYAIHLTCIFPPLAQKSIYLHVS